MQARACHRKRRAVGISLAGEARRIKPMEQSNSAGSLRTRLSPAWTLGAGLGLALFVYFVNRTGVADIADGVRKVGSAFLVVLALSGFRFAARTLAWMRCVEGKPRLRFRDAYQATLVGDALGNLTPLSLLVSEPAKAMFVRNRAPLAHTLPALAIENLFYTLSVALVIACGLVALFLRFQTAATWWLASAGLLATLFVLVCTAHWVIWNHARIASGTLEWLRRRRLVPQGHDKWEERDRWDRWLQQVRQLETRTFSLYPRDRARLLPLVLLESSFHVAALAEVYLVLSLITEAPPTLLDAFLFESTNRFINVAFKFVPLRFGVDEAGTGMLATLLAFGETAGVTLAIIRKARMLSWIAVGTACLIGRGLSIQTILDEAEAARAAGVVPNPESPSAPPNPQPATPESRILNPKSRDIAIAVMARSPTAGAARIKTRLASSVPTESDRLALYTAFLADTVLACRTVVGAVLRVAYTSEGGRDGFTALGISDDELLPQRGANLGERERYLFEDLFAAGFRRVVIIGSDLPTLPMRHVSDAIARLGEPGSNVVLGPSEDGGYSLIALSAAVAGGRVPDLFTNIQWSTASALDDTVRAAHTAGLQVELVSGWYDVDDEQGMVRLRTDLQDPRQVARASQTAAVLRKIFRNHN